jgi:ElaB/YqjD/DUF883 family membrane-anchored ribosome-binding protein
MSEGCFDPARHHELYRTQQPITTEECMDQNRNESMKGSGSMSGTAASAANSLARGKEAIGNAANEASDSAAADLRALQNDLNNLKDTVMRFISHASDEATKSAREITSNVADQMSSVASDMAGKGANVASVATQQAKTLASEIEGMARRNPLGAIAGAVVIGVLIGMMGRRNG